MDKRCVKALSQAFPITMVVCRLQPWEFTLERRLQTRLLPSVVLLFSYGLATRPWFPTGNLAFYFDFYFPVSNVVAGTVGGTVAGSVGGVVIDVLVFVLIIVDVRVADIVDVLIFVIYRFCCRRTYFFIEAVVYFFGIR